MTFLSDDAWLELLDVRATDPTAISAALAARTSRPLLANDGATFIIAIDHPARGMVGVSGQPFIMADRRDLLERTMTALADPGVDGVMATPDILDDLALLGVLDDKVAIGSINRGGLMGSAWELDDQLTGHTVASIVEQGLDGAKMLLRIDLADERSRPRSRHVPDGLLNWLQPRRLRCSNRCHIRRRRLVISISTPTRTH